MSAGSGHQTGRWTTGILSMWISGSQKGEVGVFGSDSVAVERFSSWPDVASFPKKVVIDFASIQGLHADFKTTRSIVFSTELLVYRYPGAQYSRVNETPKLPLELDILFVRI